KRVYSLRTRDSDTDVSAIAKHNGGGGHPAAAGFSVPIDQAIAMSFPDAVAPTDF
ncbi:MAG: phosphohydrolase, partial [Thiothrix nivea]